nr:MAG TPA: hypothetical protein [Caudoviricetes sp.]
MVLWDFLKKSVKICIRVKQKILRILFCIFMLFYFH